MDKRREEYIKERLQKDVPRKDKRPVATLVYKPNSSGNKTRVFTIMTGINYAGSSNIPKDIKIGSNSVLHINFIIEVSKDGKEHFIEYLASSSRITIGTAAYRMFPFKLYQLRHNTIVNFGSFKFYYYFINSPDTSRSDKFIPPPIDAISHILPTNYELSFNFPALNSQFYEIISSNYPQATLDPPIEISMRVVVAFTGFSPTPEELQNIFSLHGTITESWYNCTHLVVNSVKRTVKFLCALASGKFIVQRTWISASAYNNSFLPHLPFFPRDTSFVVAYNFSLKNTSLLAATAPLHSPQKSRFLLHPIC